MKQVSHSEITTYLDCQRKWDLIYCKGLKQDNIHFQFGSMGHRVLETGIIPDEWLYPELKEAFDIQSWKDYFEPIINDINEYFKDYDVVYREHKVETEELKGIIDLVLKHKETGKYMICDYKFSTGNKGVIDISIDEQMYLYAFMFAKEQNISPEDIDICYVNIPKQQYHKPRLLKNGALSKDKAQFTTYNLYVQAIEENGLKLEDYEDFLEEIRDKKAVSIVTSSINLSTLTKILKNTDLVIKDMKKGYVLEKQSYMCSKCDFLEYCKYEKQIRKEIENGI